MRLFFLLLTIFLTSITFQVRSQSDTDYKVGNYYRDELLKSIKIGNYENRSYSSIVSETLFGNLISEGVEKGIKTYFDNSNEEKVSKFLKIGGKVVGWASLTYDLFSISSALYNKYKYEEMKDGLSSTVYSGILTKEIYVVFYSDYYGYVYEKFRKGDIIVMKGCFLHGQCEFLKWFNPNKNIINKFQSGVAGIYDDINVMKKNIQHWKKMSEEGEIIIFPGTIDMTKYLTNKKYAYFLNLNLLFYEL